MVILYYFLIFMINCSFSQGNISLKLLFIIAFTIGRPSNYHNLAVRLTVSDPLSRYTLYTTITVLGRHLCKVEFYYGIYVEVFLFFIL